MAFRFKQFSVEDDCSSMKVGTDAVLLGAWADVKNAKNTLEVGTGSGVISLMIAQRSEAQIEAIEIDKNSSKQASKNFQCSPWASRLKSTHSSLKDFMEECNQKFDCIVSNPPFFNNSLISPNQNKTLSKHTGELSYVDLIFGIRHFLTEEGTVCLILPYVESIDFIDLARVKGLYLNKKMLICPKEKKEANRVLMEFSLTKKQIIEDSIYLREADNSFSKDYKNLCKEYYLNI